MTHFFIGCSGWHYKDWKDDFYPSNISSKHYLSYYSQIFKTVEVNNTFYNFPTINTVQSWCDQTPAEFIFSLKVNKHFTHMTRLHTSSDDLQRFYAYKDALHNKMGWFLFQFPKSFDFSKDRLSRIIKILDPLYNNVVEFRHHSWWNPYVFDGLKYANITFCTVSGFDVPDDLITLNNKAYIRFHGDKTYSAQYSNEALMMWKNKIIKADVLECWAYFNNTAQGFAPHNANLLKALLS